MKKIMGSICLALFCLGVIGVEYEMALHFGSMLILFASVAFLGALLVTLFARLRGISRSMAFTFARATRGRAVFADSPLPTSPCGEIKRDAARFRSPRSSRAEVR